MAEAIEEHYIDSGINKIVIFTKTDPECRVLSHK